jgi:glycosyltransferase involved in cell wall biosynthesis
MIEKNDLNDLDIPLVSIVTVVYNGVNYLESTIQSVVEQVYPNIEYIVVDGGSTDGTTDILWKYQNHITKYISEPDKGIYDAMNKAWEMAKIDSYILFLGAGDRVINLPSPEEIVGKAIIGSVINNGFVTRSKVDWSAKIRITIHHQSLLLHKSVSPIPPFNSKYKICGDHDFNLRLIKQGVKFQSSNSFLTYALPGGVSANLDFSEWGTVVRNNFGIHWMFASFVYYLIIKLRVNVLLRTLFPSLALNKPIIS